MARPFVRRRVEEGGSPSPQWTGGHKASDPGDDSLAQGPGFIRRTLSSLRWRNFRLFFIGQTISQTGNWLTNVALTLLILHRTGSGVAVGLLVACQYGPILLLTPALQ